MSDNISLDPNDPKVSIIWIAHQNFIDINTYR